MNAPLTADSTANAGAALPSIPFADVREGGPLRHALVNPARARALRDACLGSLPRAAHPLAGAIAAWRSPLMHGSNR